MLLSDSCCLVIRAQCQSRYFILRNIKRFKLTYRPPQIVSLLNVLQSENPEGFLNDETLHTETEFSQIYNVIKGSIFVAGH